MATLLEVKFIAVGLLCGVKIGKEKPYKNLLNSLIFS